MMAFEAMVQKKKKTRMKTQIYPETAGEERVKAMCLS